MHDWELRLSRIAGKKVVELVGYVANEWGDPTFKITGVEYEDGTRDDVEGEHDFPYVCIDIPEEFHDKDEEEEV